jgi:hypothetical protein
VWLFDLFLVAYTSCKSQHADASCSAVLLIRVGTLRGKQALQTIACAHHGVNEARFRVRMSGAAYKLELHVDTKSLEALEKAVSRLRLAHIVRSASANERGCDGRSER